MGFVFGIQYIFQRTFSCCATILSSCFLLFLFLQLLFLLSVLFFKFFPNFGFFIPSWKKEAKMPPMGTVMESKSSSSIKPVSCLGLFYGCVLSPSNWNLTLPVFCYRPQLVYFFFLDYFKLLKNLAKKLYALKLQLFNAFCAFFSPTNFNVLIIQICCNFFFKDLES